MNVLFKEYILFDDDKSIALDKEALQNFLDKEATDEIKQDYDNLDMFDSLQAWWDANYDPKGLAFDHSYHASILHDLDKMLTDFAVYKSWFSRDDFKMLHDDVHVEIHIKDFGVDSSSKDRQEELEYLIDELLYYYKGVYISDVEPELDENNAIIKFYFDDDVLSYEY